MKGLGKVAINNLRIVSRSVINSNGTITSVDPKEIPFIADRCKLVVARLDTSVNHRLV